MKEIPVVINTDDQKKELQDILKKAGYGHFACARTGTVTSQKRGVRIEWTLTSPTWHGTQQVGGHQVAYAHVEVRKAVTKRIWSNNGNGQAKHVNQTLTEYVKQPTLYHLDVSNDKYAESHVAHHKNGGGKVIECATSQELWERVIREADSCTGEKAITQAALKKRILQNVILEDIKDRINQQVSAAKIVAAHPSFESAIFPQPLPAPPLETRWKLLDGVGVKFTQRAKTSDHIASLTITIPAVKYTRDDGTTGSYQIGDLYLQLIDGKFDVLLPSLAKRFASTPIPEFADPTFDPELIYEFAMKAIEAARPISHECAEKRRQMDNLDIAIKADKTRLLKQFEELWQDTWS